MKLQLGVAFGGASVEHEISVLSAMQVMQALDQNKYDIIPLYVSKDRHLYCDERLKELKTFQNVTVLQKNLKPCHMMKLNQNFFVEESAGKWGRKRTKLDLIMPVMHGTNGEDGVFQGYLEMLGIPHTGSGVLGASIGQDKVIMKEVLGYHHLPMTDWFYVTRRDIRDMQPIFQQAKQLGYPLILKPSNLGSSIGIQSVNNETELHKGIIEAFQYDEKVIIEKQIIQLKEINISVLGDLNDMEVSVLEEVVKSEAILSYHDKYESESKMKGMAGAARKIPALVSDDIKEKIEQLARRVFHELHAKGVVRIDFMLDEANEIYVNEINTIPGSLAFYLWQESGVSFPSLLDRLVALALEDYRKKERMIFSYDTNILQHADMNSGCKGK